MSTLELDPFSRSCSVFNLKLDSVQLIDLMWSFINNEARVVQEDLGRKYAKRAAYYDLEIALFKYLLMLDFEKYRKKAVERLGLSRGDIVLDVGCGTGLNFPLIIREIGKEGRIVGLDYSAEMLERAKERVEAEGWRNVELIQGDIVTAALEPVGKLISTYVFSALPNRRDALKRCVEMLYRDGMMAVADMKPTSRWHKALTNTVAYLLGKPYGANRSLLSWDMKKEMKSLLTEVYFKEYYLGLVYVASGRKH